MLSMTTGRFAEIKDSIKDLQSVIPSDATEVSLQVDWKEMGEYDGDMVMPVVTLSYKVERS